ncbi:MAG: hypothetical protein AABX75_00895 [Nanoarchaeota archaeon]
MKQYPANTWKRKLDDLIGGYFRNRKNDCLLLKGHICSGRKEWAHIKSRRYLSTRWLLDNGFTLCSGAHFWFTHNPDYFIKFIEMNFPGRLERLNKKFNIVKQFKKSELAELYKKTEKEIKRQKVRKIALNFI